MLRTIAPGWWFCLLVCISIPRLSTAEATVEKVQIAEGICQFITSADGYVPNGNSVVVINDSDVLVFDTFSRPSSARKVLAEIKKLTPKPVRYVVNPTGVSIPGPATKSLPPSFPILKSSPAKRLAASCSTSRMRGHRCTNRTCRKMRRSSRRNVRLINNSTVHHCIDTGTARPG